MYSLPQSYNQTSKCKRCISSNAYAYLQYDEKNGVLDILHTIVPPQLEGQGIAQALTEAAVRYASVVGLKICPTCSFAKMFFTRHTQYKDMLVE